MPIRVSVASGKGGTGKTTASVLLYHWIATRVTSRVMLVDCDVEEPNTALLATRPEITNSVAVNLEIPVIDPSRCTYCRKCSEFCEFNAIAVIPPVRFAEVNGNLCHSCGACMVACEDSALRVEERKVGTRTSYNSLPGMGILEGRLDIGSSAQTHVIRSVKNNIPSNAGVILIDCPPGSSCPVVESVLDSDYVLLVTEPTPFGLHDLKIMTEVVRELKIPFGVVVNKAGLGTNEVYSYLDNQGINLLGKIPYSPGFASAYAEGNITEKKDREIARSIATIWEHLSPLLKES